ncbi:MAG: hypothetical protein IDH49_12725 [Gammaproteobacteria bacterium]|nr:hypothetical protein [Gammaproteobacteria bacterium]
MRTPKIFTAFALAGALFTGHAFAADAAGMPGDATKDHKTMWRGMMKEHQQTMMEVKGMLKDVMVILKDLNHQPSAADRQKLADHVARLDEIMKKEKEMAEKWKEMHKDMPGHGTMKGHPPMGK